LPSAIPGVRRCHDQVVTARDRRQNVGTQSLRGGPAVQLLEEPFSSLDDYLAWVEQRPAEEHYEVVDGVPVMSPSPGGPHQYALFELGRLLSRVCEPDYVVLPAPFDWLMWEHPRLQIREPDLVVIERPQARGSRLTKPPLLAVEILSPTSFERDVVAKRREYARAGLEHYWIVDPQTPQIAVYQRSDAATLDMVAHATGDAELVTEEPFRLRFRPSDLVV
jgi:Uma2 family endonuclease